MFCLYIFRYIFLGIYGMEMAIKLLARGFFLNSYTYLRDAWNWLDFIVIISAVVTIALEQSGGQSSLGNLQGIRTFRVFRVLRTISIVPGKLLTWLSIFSLVQPLFEQLIQKTTDASFKIKFHLFVKNTMLFKSNL